MPRFLNRVLALDVDHQNALFDHFVDLFDQTVRYAKANGTFDEGVTDIKALAIRIAKPSRVVHTDEITNAQTTHYTLEIDVPKELASQSIPSWNQIIKWLREMGTLRTIAA